MQVALPEQTKAFTIPDYPRASCHSGKVHDHPTVRSRSSLCIMQSLGLQGTGVQFVGVGDDVDDDNDEPEGAKPLLHGGVMAPVLTRPFFFERCSGHTSIQRTHARADRPTVHTGPKQSGHRSGVGLSVAPDEAVVGGAIDCDSALVGWLGGLGGLISLVSASGTLNKRTSRSLHSSRGPPWWYTIGGARAATSPDGTAGRANQSNPGHDDPFDVGVLPNGAVLVPCVC